MCPQITVSIAPDRARAMIHKIAEKFGMSNDYLVSTKAKPACIVRAGICLALRKRDWSLNEIGKVISRDHTSVMNLLLYRIDCNSEGYKEIDKIVGSFTPTLVKGMIMSGTSPSHPKLTKGQLDKAHSMIVPIRT
jgi:hypothetical protein